MSAACACILTFLKVKVILSLLVGIPLGIIPGIVLAIGVIIITVIRYPANLYKTFRVTILTTLLKKRLKFLVLLSLTIIQLLYPAIVVFVVVLAGIIGWCGFSVATTYNGHPPWKTWSELGRIFREYRKLHVKFYDETLETYNHPTGVPLNWNGVSYDIPEFGVVKTLMGVLLTIYGVVTVPVGTIIILVIKYPFLHIRMLYLYLKTFSIPLPFLPFWFCGLAIVLAIGPVLFVLAVMISPLAGLHCPYIAITHNLNLNHGLKEALNLLIKLDKKTYDFKWNFRLLKDINLNLHYQPPAIITESTTPANQYWDLFIKKCKEVCQDSKAKGWVTEEDIEGAMPNVLTAIPAMAILKILLQSIEKDGSKEIIVWDDTHICDERNKPKDDLVNFFWPKITNILKKLKTISKDERIYLMAQLCANSERNTEALDTALIVSNIDEEKKSNVHDISADINNIVIILLRMEQMQKRLAEYLI